MQLAKYRGIELYIARNGLDFQATIEVAQHFHVATNGINADLGAGELQADIAANTFHRQLAGRCGEYIAVATDTCGLWVKAWRR